MNEKSERELDELMARHLGACLDVQLGRATAAFETELRTSRRWHWTRWASVGVAMAAGLTVAWVVWRPTTPPGRVMPPVVQVTPVEDVPMVQAASWSPMTDDGTVMIDDRPVRRLRRKVVEEVEWYDAQAGATVRTTTPGQQIFLIGLKTD